MSSHAQTTSVAGAATTERTAPQPKTAGQRKEARGVNGTAITLVGLVLLSIAWSLAVAYLDIPSYILPAPLAVWRALWSGIAVSPTSPLGYYLPLWGTLKNAALGLAIGSGLGLMLGSLMAEVIAHLGVMVTRRFPARQPGHGVRGAPLISA